MELIIRCVLCVCLIFLIYLWASEVFYLHQIEQNLRSLSPQKRISFPKGKACDCICLGYPSRHLNEVADVLFKFTFKEKPNEKTFLRHCELTDQYEYVVLFLCDPIKGFVKIGEIKNKNYQQSKQTK